MKRYLIFICLCWITANMAAQSPAQEPTADEQPLFKPHYDGTSVNTGVIFSPGYGSAFYVAPSVSFRATPRLFINTGIGITQYSLLPAQENNSSRQGVTGAYVFAEGLYYLNDRIRINGYVRKNLTPSGPLREVSPYSATNESMHFGIDYKLTPNITIGARFGYSNGQGNGMYDYYNPFYPY